MQTFTIRDLRNHTGDLIREARAGRLSVVSMRGRPVFVAVPIDEYLTKDGINVAIAINLFNNQRMTAEQAARLAGMSLSEFLAVHGSKDSPIR